MNGFRTSARDAVAGLRTRVYLVAFVAHAIVFGATAVAYFVFFDDKSWLADLLVVWATALVAHLAMFVFVSATDAELLTDAEHRDEVWTRSLFRETEAMMRWASASGKQIPESAAESIRAFRRNNARLFEAAAPPEVGLTSSQTVRAHRARQTELWAIPPSQESVRTLTQAHNQMTSLVAPASPRSVRLIITGRRSRLVPFLGPIKLIRHMAYLSVALLGLVVALTIAGDPFQEVVDDGAGEASESEPVDGEAAAEEPETTEVAPEVAAALGNDAGTRAASVIYLLGTAGLGAAFFAMWKANSYVQKATYDPIFEPTYWIRFVLGLVGGFVLAVIVRSAFPDLTEFGAPVLAIVGGFSADVVFRILQRIADTVDTLVRGSADDRVDAQARVAAANAASQEAESRIAVAGKLVLLQSVLNQQGAESGSEQLTSMLDDLLGTETAATTVVNADDVDPAESDVIDSDDSLQSFSDEEIDSVLEDDAP